MDEEDKKIRDRLWNSGMNATSYEGTGEKYQAAILEQYKLYVEMADRISNRRGLTNTFFLTLNTAIFTIIGFFCSKVRKATWPCPENAEIRRLRRFSFPDSGLRFQDDV